MDDALVVGLLERGGDLQRDLARLADRDVAAFVSRKVLALDQLERQVGRVAGLFETVDRRDVGVVERGQQLRLAVEAGQTLRVGGDVRGQRLDRRRPVEPRVGRGPDLTHPALAELALDAVVRDGLAGSEGHRGSLSQVPF